MTWPLPVFSFECNAANAPSVANVAASESPREIPARAGMRSGSPITYRRPPMASPTDA